jgi:hypothetical protein
LLLFGSTLSNNKHPTNGTKDGYAVRALHPRPEGRGFTRTPINLDAGVGFEPTTFSL